MKTHAIVITGILLLLLALPRPSGAVPIVIFADTAGSTEGLGDFEGLLTYTASSGTEATLEIELHNTTPGGGFLTAFALNNPDDLISAITLAATDPDFGLIGTAPFGDDVDADPFGNYDFGASISSEFLSVIGPPSAGIAVSTTETFTFSLTGSDLNTLSELSFVNEFPSGLPVGECCDEWMVVRFLAIGTEDDSDIVPADFEVTQIPEPNTLLLMGLGLAGVALWRRQRAS